MLQPAAVATLTRFHFSSMGQEAIGASVTLWDIPEILPHSA